MHDDNLTIDAAAKMMNIELATIQAWLDRGLPHSVDQSGTIYIRHRDLDAFLAQEGQGAARDAATET